MIALLEYVLGLGFGLAALLAAQWLDMGGHRAGMERVRRADFHA